VGTNDGLVEIIGGIREMRITSMNLVVLVTVPLNIWLGCTGRVDWWVIALIWSLEFKLNLKLRG